MFSNNRDFIDFIDKVDSLYDPSIKQGFIYYLTSGDPNVERRRGQGRVGATPGSPGRDGFTCYTLTMSRIEGRDEAAAVLREIGRVPQDPRAGVHRQRRRAGLRHVRLHWPGGARLVCSSSSPRARRAPIRRSTFTPGPGRS